MVNASDVVIWSADVDRPTLAAKLLPGSGEPRSPLRYIKLDRLGLTRMGLETIGTVQRWGYQVFADAKIAEIPDKVVEIAKLHLAYRPWMLNVMAGICSTGLMKHADPKQVDALKRFADECHAVGTKPCAVTVLTSKTETIARWEFGKSSCDQVLEYAELLFEAGFTDMVCSPQEAATVRSMSGYDGLQLNCPGIRMPGSAADDQARIDTPAGAMANGVNRLVIGRDLTTGNLAENFSRIAAHLNQ